MHTLRILAVAGLLATTACTDPLTPVSRIERARILGARVDVAGAPGRATPLAGEQATVTWIVATPDGQPRELAWAFVACAADPAAPAGCSGEPFAFAEGAGATPTLAFETPAIAGSLRVAGIICEAGRPSVDSGGLPACEGDGAIATIVELGIGSATNHHPCVGELALGDGVWPAEPARCGDPATTVSARDPIEIGWRAVDDREVYPTADGEARELLQLATFATAGDVEDHFAIVEADDGSLERTIEWVPPNEVAADGTIVHFTFVIRDGRGGIDAATRSLCVVP